MAKVAAIKQLQNGGRVKGPPPPDNWLGWHPAAGTFWEDLDVADTPEVRARWWANLREWER